MSIYAVRSLNQSPWEGNTDRLYQGLPPMIADSLPDDWGNTLFMAWLRDHQISKKQISPLDHLSFIGDRAMGALEYLPAFEPGANDFFSVDVQQLYEFSKQRLNRQKAIVLDRDNATLWNEVISVNAPPGGKRPKAIVAIHERTGEVISGQGKIPEGYKHYILKYDDNSSYPFASMEYIYYQMAVDAGIKMMPSILRRYGEVTHFLTERFDRIGNEKVHVQTLAAMAPWVHSYEGLFEVMRTLNLPYEDQQQQFLRMVFNVLSRNIDDHNKNFAFCMHTDGSWHLSAAYDLTFSVDLKALPLLNRHSLSINGKLDSISIRDLEVVGLENDIRDTKTLIKRVQHAVGQFSAYAKALRLPKAFIEAVEAELASVVA